MRYSMNAPIAPRQTLARILTFRPRAILSSIWMGKAVFIYTDTVREHSESAWVQVRFRVPTVSKDLSTQRSLPGSSVVDLSPIGPTYIIEIWYSNYFPGDQVVGRLGFRVVGSSLILCEGSSLPLSPTITPSRSSSSCTRHGDSCRISGILVCHRIFLRILRVGHARGN